jgi:hypothetical protein
VSPRARRRLPRWVIACSLVVVFVCQVVQRTTGTVYVAGPSVAAVPGVPRLGPDSSLFEVIRREPNGSTVRWHNTHIHGSESVRVAQRGQESVKVMGRGGFSR